MYYAEKGLFWSYSTLENRPIPNQDWITLKIDQWRRNDPGESKLFYNSRNEHFKAIDLAREDAELIKTTGFDSKGERHYRITDQVSETPRADQSAYEVNDTCLELRTPFDEKRGLITLVMVSLLFAPVVIGLPDLFNSTIPSLQQGINVSSGTPLGFLGYFTFLFSALLTLSWIGIVVYFGHPIIRLEAFVQRRILVRFNRQTRTVYVHRPAYAGGIAALPWDKVIVGIKADDSEASGMGLPLALGWGPEHSATGITDLLLVGRLARGNSEILNLWEYIRRYMESDRSQPHGLPRPKRVGKFPWPWRSIRAALSLVWPLFLIRELRWLIPLFVLILPAALPFAMGHWVSQWLCWEPRWPRAIRKACDDGWVQALKPWLIDIGTWAMAAATLYGVVRYFAA